MRKIISMIAPFIVLLTAWAISMNAESMGIAMQSLFSILPYMFALLTIILSIWYQNSNSFFFACFMLIAYIYLTVFQDTQLRLHETVTFMSVLIPINAVWLNFAQERGILSTYGRNKAIVIAAEIIWALISILTKSNAANLQPINQAVINISVPAIVLYILCIFLLLLNFILKSHYLSLIYISVLFSSFIMLHFAHRTMIVAIFTTAIFLMAVLALMEISYSLAFYDTLTGVLTRRALEQELLKLDGRYIIAMVDLDYFKRINDNYGHDVGDEVLKMTASIIKQKAGNSKVFRYGGEEFVVLFIGMTYNDVVLKLDNIRKSIERRTFIVRNKNRPKEKPKKISKSVLDTHSTMNITVSIGVAQKSSPLKTPYDVIKKADEALYKSKSKGRNCITKYKSVGGFDG